MLSRLLQFIVIGIPVEAIDKTEWALRIVPIHDRQRQMSTNGRRTAAEERRVGESNGCSNKTHSQQKHIAWVGRHNESESESLGWHNREREKETDRGWRSSHNWGPNLRARRAARMNLWRWLGSGFGCRFGCSTAPLRLFVRCRSSSATVSGNGKLTKLKLEPQSQRERLRERPRANNNNQRREAFLREALFELCVLAAPFPPSYTHPNPLINQFYLGIAFLESAGHLLQFR